MKLRERLDALAVAVLIAVDGLKYETISPAGKQSLSRAADMLGVLGARLPQKPQMSTEGLIRGAIVDVLAQGGTVDYYTTGSAMHSRLGELWGGSTSAYRELQRRSKAQYVEDIEVWETCMQVAAEYLGETVVFTNAPPVDDAADGPEDAPTRTVEDVETGAEWQEDIPLTTKQTAQEHGPTIQVVHVD